MQCGLQKTKVVRVDQPVPVHGGGREVEGVRRPQVYDGRQFRVDLPNAGKGWEARDGVSLLRVAVVVVVRGSRA